MLYTDRRLVRASSTALLGPGKWRPSVLAQGKIESNIAVCRELALQPPGLVDPDNVSAGIHVVLIFEKDWVVPARHKVAEKEVDEHQRVEVPTVGVHAHPVHLHVDLGVAPKIVVRIPKDVGKEWVLGRCNVAFNKKNSNRINDMRIKVLDMIEEEKKGRKKKKKKKKKKRTNGQPKR